MQEQSKYTEFCSKKPASWSLDMKIKLWPYVCLAIGTAFLIFSNGRWIIPLGTWLAPVFILRFTRTQKPLFGLAFSLLANIVAFIIMWPGLIPMDGIFYYLIAGGIGLLFWLPYLFDRLIAPQLKGAWATLVFPLAWATVEYIMMLTSPFPTWGALGYTQYGNLPLMQVVSVTGLGGIAFLITWFASIANFVWEQEFAWARIYKAVGLYGGTLALVLLLGGIRLVFFAPNADTVQVASVVPTPPTQALWLEALTNRPSTETSLQILDEYLDRSQQQARAGAKIVTWAESAIFVPAGQETLFVDRGRKLADEENIHLLMSLIEPTAGDAEMLENKVIWIEPDGNIAWQYLKTLIVPGDNQVAGDGRIQTSDTPYGRVAAAICFDLDQPILIRQAGMTGTAILFGPSDDWQEVDKIHAQMASFRAIEIGVSIVRPATEGLSFAFDYQGHVLATSDYFTSGGGIMVAHIPTKGVNTIYTMIGDLFSWLCVAGFIILTGAAFWKRRR
jgi:apolipoprotein N-acyltransferase